MYTKYTIHHSQSYYNVKCIRLKTESNDQLLQLGPWLYFCNLFGLNIKESLEFNWMIHECMG